MMGRQERGQVTFIHAGGPLTDSAAVWIGIGRRPQNDGKQSEPLEALMPELVAILNSVRDNSHTMDQAVEAIADNPVISKAVIEGFIRERTLENNATAAILCG